MATEETEGAGTERATLMRLAERGEEALKRLSAEIEKNQRMSEARDRLVEVEKSVLNRLNIASLSEVEELRAKVAELEELLAKAEGGARKKPAAAAQSEP